MFLVEGGPVAEVRSGDVLIERVTNNGVETAYPATVPMVFGTVPALASYRDETMAFPQATSYPVAQGTPGTFGNGLPVGDGAEDPDPDVEATFTFWRPQRLRTPGDPGRAQWMDIGGLTYTLAGFFGPGGRQFCPQGCLRDDRPQPDAAPGRLSRSRRVRRRRSGPPGRPGQHVDLHGQPHPVLRGEWGALRPGGSGGADPARPRRQRDRQDRAAVLREASLA